MLISCIFSLHCIWPEWDQLQHAYCSGEAERQDQKPRGPLTFFVRRALLPKDPRSAGLATSVWSSRSVQRSQEKATRESWRGHRPLTELPFRGRQPAPSQPPFAQLEKALRSRE